MRERLQEPGGDSVGRGSWAAGLGASRVTAQVRVQSGETCPLGCYAQSSLHEETLGFLWILGSIPQMSSPVSTDSLRRGGCNRR